MATVAHRRRANLRLNENLARAAAPSIKRVIAAERARVRKATSGTTTPEAWEAAARGAVSDTEWVAAIVSLWTSRRLVPIWEEQQELLGTDYEMPASVIKSLTAIAETHGLSIAESRRDRYSRTAKRIADQLDD